MGRHELLYALLPLDQRNRWKKVSPQKALCIEGFPRSANSFLSVAFRRYNPTAKCAHHMHAPMQVIKSVEFGVPCIVLIRNPLDAIASVLVVDQALSKTLAIQSYINFYERILHLRNDVIVAEFKDVTQAAHTVIEKVNRRYGTAFRMEPIGELEKAEIFQQLQMAQQTLQLPETLVAIPTANKKQLKAQILSDLERHPLLRRAESLYREFLAG